MTYEQHYLHEDQDLYNEQLHTIINSCNRLYYRIANADFYSVHLELRSISYAMKVAEALNHKKIKRDGHNFENVVRRNF